MGVDRALLRASRPARGTRAAPPAPGGRSHLLYRLREGCRWRALPHDFAPWSTVASHWRLWRRRGLLAAGRRRRAGHALARGGAGPQPPGPAPRHPRQPERGRRRPKERSAASTAPSAARADRVTWPSIAPGHALGRAGVRGQQSRQRKRPAPSWQRPSERHSSLWSFTADKGYRRQAEKAARERLGRELPSAPSRRKKGLRAGGLPLAGRAHLRLAGPAPAALQGTTRRASPAPKPGSGLP